MLCDRGGGFLGGALGVVPAIMYHCNAVPVFRHKTFGLTNYSHSSY